MECCRRKKEDDQVHQRLFNTDTLNEPLIKCANATNATEHDNTKKNITIVQ